MNILIVDDMEVFRRQIKRLKIWSEDKRFNLKYEAKDGKEALDILENNLVDLVIADIKMPAINGLELLKEIKARKISVETILLSEHSDFNFARNAIQYGAFDYMLKPVKEKELGEILNQVYNHILKEREEKIRIEILEKEVLGKESHYYPNNKIINISNKIMDNNTSLSEDIDSLLNNLLNDFKKEHLKIGRLLENIYMDIVNLILKENSWINLYLDIDKIQYLDLKNLNNLDLEIKIFKEGLIELSELLGQLYISADKTLVQDIINYILRNIDSVLDISTIADKFYLSKNHISYVFKEETKMTLGNYITIIKIERAKKLIKDGNMRNYEISETLNYKNPEYFEKLFKKYTKYTPSEYKTR